MVINTSREMNVLFVTLGTSRASKFVSKVGEHDSSSEKERTRYNTLLFLSQYTNSHYQFSGS